MKDKKVKPDIQISSDPKLRAPRLRSFSDSNNKDLQNLKKRRGQQLQTIEEYKKKLTKNPNKKSFFQKRIVASEQIIKELDDQISSIQAQGITDQSQKKQPLLNDTKWRDSIEKNFESLPSIETQIIFLPDTAGAISNLHLKMKGGVQKTCFGQLIEILKNPDHRFYNKGIQFVEELCSLKHNHKLIFQTQILPEVLHVMITTSDIDIKIIIVSLLSQIAANEKVKLSIILANGIPNFLQIIENEKEINLIKPTYIILSNLLISSVQDLRPIFLNAKGFDIFLDHFLTTTHEEIRINSLRLMTLLGFESKEEKKKFLKKGGIPILLSIMNLQNNLTLCRISIGILEKFSEISNIEFLDQIGTENNLKIISKFLILPDRNNACKILSIIRCLCEHKRYYSLLCDPGINLLSSILHLIKYQDIRIKIPALACLPFIISTESHLRNFIYFGGLQYISESLLIPETTRISLIALVKLSTQSNFHKHFDDFYSSEIFNHLHTLLLSSDQETKIKHSSPEEEEDIKFLILNVYARISYCYYTKEFVKDLSKRKIISHLFNLLSSVSLQSKKIIIITLSNFFIFNTNSFLPSYSKKSRLKKLIQFLHTNNNNNNSLNHDNNDEDDNSFEKSSESFDKNHRRPASYLLNLSYGKDASVIQIKDIVGCLLCNLAIDISVRKVISKILSKENLSISSDLFSCFDHFQKILKLPEFYDPLLASGAPMFAKISLHDQINSSVLYFQKYFIFEKNQNFSQFKTRKEYIKLSKSYIMDFIHFILNEDSTSQDSGKNYFDSSTDCEENVLNVSSDGAAILDGSQNYQDQSANSNHFFSSPGFRSHDEIQKEENEIKKARQNLQKRKEETFKLFGGISRSRRSTQKSGNLEDNLRYLAKQMTLEDLRIFKQQQAQKLEHKNKIKNARESSLDTLDEKSSSTSNELKITSSEESSESSATNTTEKEENRIYAEEYALLTRRLSKLKKEKENLQIKTTPISQSSLSDQYHSLQISGTSSSYKTRYFHLLFLLSYEKFYYQYLENISLRFYFPLEKIFQFSNRSIISKKKTKKIFGNIKEILNIHAIIIDRLQYSLPFCSASFCVGELYLSMVCLIYLQIIIYVLLTVFSHQVPLFQMYYPFRSELSTILTSLTKALKKSKEFSEVCCLFLIFLCFFIFLFAFYFF